MWDSIESLLVLLPTDKISIGMKIKRWESFSSKVQIVRKALQTIKESQQTEENYHRFGLILIESRA